MEATRLDHIIFEGTPIRYISRGGEIWFCARDITLALNYKDLKAPIKAHVDKEDKNKLESLCDDKNNLSLSYNEKQQIYINEVGLYFIMANSRAATIKNFKNWIVGEVLPSIKNSEINQLKQQLQEKDVLLRKEIDENAKYKESTNGYINELLAEKEEYKADAKKYRKIKKLLMD